MKISNKPSLLRLPDALLPTSLLAYSALCPGDALAMRLYLVMFAVSLGSLFAARGARIAFARQPSMRDVRGSVKSALLMSLAGGGVAAVAAALARKGCLPDIWPLIAAGTLLNIEHIFYEYMYAIGDSRSACLSRGLTALFAFAGLLLANGRALWLVGAAAISALVALVVALVMGDGARGRPNGAIFRAASRAALQTVLYPAAALAAVLLLRPARYSAAFFAGLTLYELCKTPFRRTSMEARGFNRALLFIIVICALGTVLFATGLITNARLSDVPVVCIAVLLAAACALGLFGNLKKNNE